MEPARSQQHDPEAPIDRIAARAFRIPTDRPEADGTLRWDSTTLVTVHASAAGETGFGYTYSTEAVVPVVAELADCVLGEDALAIEQVWNALVARVRNIGRAGVASTAISALDSALWDLKARLLGLPLASLLGIVRREVPVYGSGGFTSYSTAELCEQLAGWVDGGIARVKMKVGTDPGADRDRVAAARRAIGDAAALMVDANGAYTVRTAIEKAHEFAAFAVAWFEEPVSSDDLEGLGEVRRREPPGMAVAAGEYGYDVWSFRRMLDARAVDVLQADATRCLGITGFLAASRLCQAFGVPLSAHTAPSLHLHPCCASTPLVHVEYFHDHVRIERMLFDGFVTAEKGILEPDWSRPGVGLELKRRDADPYAIAEGSWAA